MHTYTYYFLAHMTKLMVDVERQKSNLRRKSTWNKSNREKNAGKSERKKQKKKKKRKMKKEKRKINKRDGLHGEVLVIRLPLCYIEKRM